MSFRNTKTETHELSETITMIAKENKLILFNDDVNTFDWVIECLVKICRHDFMQAAQCADIVHYSGKCIVKEGEYDQLEPMAAALLESGLSVVIE